MIRILTDVFGLYAEQREDGRWYVRDYAGKMMRRVDDGYTSVGLTLAHRNPTPGIDNATVAHKRRNAPCD